MDKKIQTHPLETYSPVQYVVIFTDKTRVALVATTRNLLPIAQVVETALLTHSKVKNKRYSEYEVSKIFVNILTDEQKKSGKESK